MTALQRRFWRRVKLDATTGCLIWTGAITDGYGIISVDGRLMGTHQLVWIWAHGPIPEGMVPDHTCRNRACCRLEHLELVTSKENTLRGEGPTAINARKTHCPRGHPYDEENTIRQADGRRRCRACARDRKPRSEGRRDRVREKLEIQASEEAHGHNTGDYEVRVDVPPAGLRDDQGQDGSLHRPADLRVHDSDAAVRDVPAPEMAQGLSDCVEMHDGRCDSCGCVVAPEGYCGCAPDERDMVMYERRCHARALLARLKGR